MKKETKTKELIFQKAPKQKDPFKDFSVELSKVIHDNLKADSREIDARVEKGSPSYFIRSSAVPLMGEDGLDLESFQNFEQILSTLYEIGTKILNSKIAFCIFIDKVDETVNRINFFGHMLSLISAPNARIIVEPASNSENLEKSVDDFVKIFSQTQGVQGRVVIKNGKGLWNCGNLHKAFFNYCKFKHSFGFQLAYDNKWDVKNPTLDKNGNKVGLKEQYLKFYKTWTETPIFVRSEKSEPIDFGFDCAWLET